MRITRLNISEEEQQKLQNGFRNGDTHCFRMRCHVIILKSQGKMSKDVGDVTDMSEQSVNKWVKRYRAEGIDGLRTKLGQGRKPIINETDTAAVKQAIEDDMIRVKNAKEAWQTATGKEASEWTFKRFLGVLAQDLGE